MHWQYNNLISIIPEKNKTKFIDFFRLVFQMGTICYGIKKSIAVNTQLSRQLPSDINRNCRTLSFNILNETMNCISLFGLVAILSSTLHIKCWQICIFQSGHIQKYVEDTRISSQNTTSSPILFPAMRNLSHPVHCSSIPGGGVNIPGPRIQICFCFALWDVCYADKKHRQTIAKRRLPRDDVPLSLKDSRTTTSCRGFCCSKNVFS